MFLLSADNNLLFDGICGFLALQGGDQSQTEGDGAAGRGAGDDGAVGNGSLSQKDSIAHLLRTAGEAGDLLSISNAKLGENAIEFPAH